MENAPICWNYCRGAVCIRRGDHSFSMKMFADSRSVSFVARVMFSSCLRICRYYTALLRWSTLPLIAPSLRELSLLITVRTGSMTVGGSSSQRWWADSPTLSRSSCSTPADSKEEDLRGLFIEAGMRQKVCMFSRARPGKDALEWSDVQLATALTLTPSALQRRKSDHSQCLHLLSIKMN